MTQSALESSLRCSHCGRAVRETLHTRDSWRVDYYLLHTGDVEQTTLVRDEWGGAVSFLKLIRPEDVITCADCYRDPAVRDQREERFRPELHSETMS